MRQLAEQFNLNNSSNNNNNNKSAALIPSKGFAQRASNLQRGL